MQPVANALDRSSADRPMHYDHTERNRDLSVRCLDVLEQPFDVLAQHLDVLDWHLDVLERVLDVLERHRDGVQVVVQHG